MGNRIAKVVSGGEAGAERAALYIADLHGINYGGWAAMGGLTEDLRVAPGVMGRYPHLVEVQSMDPHSALRLNVQESDATLIVLPATAASIRAIMAQEAAEEYGRPYLVTDGASLAEVLSWLTTLPAPLTLHVVGAKNSEVATAYDTTFFLLQDLLDAS